MESTCKVKDIWKVKICFLTKRDEEKKDIVEVENYDEAIDRIKKFREYCNQEGLIIFDTTITHIEKYDSYDIDLL